MGQIKEQIDNLIKSSKVFMPGFNYCLGGMNVKLTGLENPDTRARIRIDSEVLEVAKGEKFLENACTIKNIIKRGINQVVEISCKEDERTNSFGLFISPKASLSINGTTQEYSVGDKLYEHEDRTIIYKIDFNTKIQRRNINNFGRK